MNDEVQKAIEYFEKDLRNSENYALFHRTKYTRIAIQALRQMETEPCPVCSVKGYIYWSRGTGIFNIPARHCPACGRKLVSE